MATESKPAQTFYIRFLDGNGDTVISEMRLEKSRLTIGEKPADDISLLNAPRSQLSLDQQGKVIFTSKAPPVVGGKVSSKISVSKGAELDLGHGNRLRYRGVDPARGHLFDVLLTDSGQRDIPVQRKSRGGLWVALIALIGLMSIPLWWPQFEANKAPLVGEQWLAAGPLHAAHEFASSQCSDCHSGAFSSIKNESCFACHTMKRHLTREQTGNHPLCSSCHREHNEPGTLLNLDSRLCTHCHNDPQVVAQVLAPGLEFSLPVIAEFPDSHPEFEYDLGSTWLKFSHRQHLVADLSDNNSPLDCASCHRVDTDGVSFDTVSFASTCQQCHQLALTENGVLELPHGNLQELRQWLQDQLQLSTQQAGERITELLSQGQCAACHSGSDTDPVVSAQAGLAVFEHSGLTGARFSHKRHDGSSDCSHCHSGAEDSAVAEDLLLPASKVCAQCHDSDGGRRKLVTSCGQCHQFHTIDWDE